MKREIVKVAVCGMLSVCMTVSTGFANVNMTPDTQSETQGLITLTENKTKLDEITEALPEQASIAVETQEWYNKALADTKDSASIYSSANEKSRVKGKMYKNTILNIEEKGEEWSKVSSGDVEGYVKNDSLAFGLDAVERAEKVCPEKKVNGEIVRETQDAKTMKQIALEEAARKAEEEARKAAEKRAAEEAKRKEAARRKAAGLSPKMSASVNDRTLLAALIYCEAGGEPYQGKVAVGAVVLNRVRSGKFPNTIKGVVYQRGQFGPAVTGKLGRVLASGKTTSACYQAADAALAGSNPIGSKLYFGNGNRGQRIGNHYFH